MCECVCVYNRAIVLTTGYAAPSSQPLDGGWLMVGSPACAAAVAAPIRRLCVLYLEVSHPLLKSRSRNIALIAWDVSGRTV